MSVRQTTDMPKFVYQAKRSPTVIISGEIDARTEDDAVHQLSNMGLTPVHVEAGERTLERARATVAARAVPQAGRGSKLQVRSRDIDAFTRQLSTLLKSNVPILRALSLIAGQSARREYNELVTRLADQVSRGDTLSDTMSRYPQAFNAVFLSLVTAGERGGALPVTLLRLADYREKELETRRRIQAALAYPTFVIAVGALTVLGVLTFFLPRVIDLFLSLDQELPRATRMLIGASEFMHGNWYWIVATVVLVCLLAARNRPGSRQKTVVDAFKLHVPVVRTLVRNAEIAKFARTLSLLVRNGISVHESIFLSTRTLNNEALKHRVEQVGTDIVNKGVTLSASLGQTGIFPAFAVNMIGVGEESGNLEDTLDDVAEVYEREVAQSVKLMLALLEPLLILIVGAIVAFVVFAMLLPIFDMGGIR